jgi:exodeoxyribonuclease-3
MNWKHSKAIAASLFILTFWCCSSQKTEKTFSSFSVMTFNVLYTTSEKSTYECIQTTGCDIIGLQEASKKRVQQVADSLGFYSYSFDKNSGCYGPDDCGILSRFPIIEKKDNYVIIELPNQERVALSSVHLVAYPYEPYDLRDKKISTADEAIASAAKIRIPQLTPVLHDLDSLKKLEIPVFLTGDFNEPSHLDWTEKTAQDRLHFSMVVEWPCSKAILNTGFKDAYRQAFRDEVAKKGITWTTNPAENEVYDRIDFVYYSQIKSWKLDSVKRIGRPDNEASFKIEGYESDHFGVIAWFSGTK